MSIRAREESVFNRAEPCRSWENIQDLFQFIPWRFIQKISIKILIFF